MNQQMNAPTGNATKQAANLQDWTDVSSRILSQLQKPGWTAQSVAQVVQDAVLKSEAQLRAEVVVPVLLQSLLQMKGVAAHPLGRIYTQGQWLENVLWALQIQWTIEDVVQNHPDAQSIPWHALLPYPEPDPELTQLKQQVEQLQASLQASKTKLNEQIAQAAADIAQSNRQVERRTSAVVDARVRSQVSAVVSAQIEARTRDAVQRQLYQTLSWRVTKPLRWGLRFLRKILGRPVDELAWQLEKRLTQDPNFHTEPTAQQIEAISQSALEQVKKQEAALEKAAVAQTEQEQALLQAQASNITDQTSSQSELSTPLSWGEAPAGRSYQEWVAHYDTMTPDQLDALRKDAAHWMHQCTESPVWQLPVISILVMQDGENDESSLATPMTHAQAVQWLKSTVDSVNQQCYGLWELFVVSASDVMLASIASQSVVHYCESYGDAVNQMQGAWLMVLQSGETLEPHALLRLVQHLKAHSSETPPSWVYTDDDAICANSNGALSRSDPHFKTDWNPDLFLARPFAGPASLFPVEAAKSPLQKQATQEPLATAAPLIRLQLALNQWQHNPSAAVGHVTKILAHRTQTWHQWREQMQDALTLNISQAVKYVEPQTQVLSHAEGWRIVYAQPTTPPFVNLLIPSKNNVRLLRQCIDSLLQITSYKAYEIIVIDNGTDDLQSLDYLRTLQSRPQVRVIRDGAPFNFSALNNIAANVAHASVIALINDDVQVTHADWLSEMVSQVMRPEVGVVGAKLLYPNDTVQHAGVALVGGWARHIHRHLPREMVGYQGRAQLVQRVSAVTGACLMIRKAIWDEVGGLDEVELPIGWSDIDLCLKVRRAGYHVIYTPHAQLIHHESASRGHDTDPIKMARAQRDLRIMHERWGQLLWDDGVAYNPNLTDGAEDMQLAWPPRAGQNY